MASDWLVKGMLVGLAISVPVGPIAILCIQRTLANGRRYGLASGLGAASADTLSGGAAVFGLTFVSGFLLGHQAWLRLVAGVFLIVVGIRTFLKPPAPAGQGVDVRGLVRAYASTFFLTITNPMTLLALFLAFYLFGLTDEHRDYATSADLIAGLFLGSALWWVLLTIVSGWFRALCSRQVLVWVNRVAGAAIGICGIVVMVSRTLAGRGMP